MNRTASLAADNIRCLQQCLDLLHKLDKRTYIAADARYQASAVGGHVRHNLDHYSCFFAGIGAGRIDYDARVRDPRLETDPAHAAQQVSRLITALEQVVEEVLDHPVAVKMDCDEKRPESAMWQLSTIGRELQFLLSHTVHHNAIIALILRLNGQTVDAQFGVAPSTLRYQRERPSCAPSPG